MRRYHLLLLFFLCSGGCLFAQTTIFDALDKKVPGKGTVTINQSWAIRSAVGKQSYDMKIETDGDTNYILMPGYRIQVFADNNQRTAKEEAESKELQIKELIAGIPTYVKYNAPFWRLYVGDFITHEEAFSMMSRLVNAFPTFKKEIQIKEEEVRIPLNERFSGR